MSNMQRVLGWSAVTCLLIVTGLSPAAAQEPLAAQTFEAAQPAAADSKPGLFRSSDLAYAA
ncbi:MAG: hypothetical protein V3S56_05095, partial [Gemmatimonadota bacterium]